MPDYDDADVVEPGFYLVQYYAGGVLGPFASVNEMARTCDLYDYPDSGYVIWSDPDGSISNIPSLNPDDLLDQIADGLAEGNAPDPVVARRYLADAGL